MVRCFTPASGSYLKKMSSIRNAVSRFVGNEEGAALVEYALLLALIAVVVILTLTSVGQKVSSKFSEVAAQL